MPERIPLRRIALVMAVLAAVAVRLLTPLGWMPNAGGAGGSLLVICTGEGPRLAGGFGLPDHGPDRNPDHGPPHDQCLFAGLSLVDAPDHAVVPTPPARFVLAVAKTVVSRPAWRARDQHRPQFPRGPPQPV